MSANKPPMTDAQRCAMPLNADSLRSYLRDVLEQDRISRATSDKSVASSFTNIWFAARELKAIGRGDIYDEEYRRHDCLLRGFAPPKSID